MERESSKESQCSHQAGAYAGFPEENLKLRRIKSQEDAPVRVQGHATSQMVKLTLYLPTFLSQVREIFILS